MVSGRLGLRPIAFLTVAAEVARYNRDSTRYRGCLDWRGFLLHGEYIAQQRRLKRAVDWGFFGLAAYRVEPWLQLVLKRELFQRPAIASSQYNAATTAGVNIDLPDGRASSPTTSLGASPSPEPSRARSSPSSRCGF